MIGCDIIEISRISTTEAFQNRVFTQLERDYISNYADPSQRIAGLFCAKEAVFKALNVDKMIYQEIEIHHHSNGKPFVVFHGTTKEHFENNYTHIDMSISHSTTVAMAVCEVR